MTHHNHPEYTDLALRTLVANSFENLAIVVYDDGSDEPYKVPKDVTAKGVFHKVLRSEPPQGWIASANALVDHWIYSMPECTYMVLTNNDVAFTKDWDHYLVRCFEEHADCGIAGPVTNQPGHQPHQLVDSHPLPSDDLKIFMECREHYERRLKEMGMDLQAIAIPFVNGFCFMLHRDRLLHNSDGERVLFEGIDGHPHYGGEDLYQMRMRSTSELRSYVVGNSWVYHFKDVTMQSALSGRMGLDPARLPRLRRKEVPQPA